MHELEDTELRCDDPAILLVTRRLAQFFKVLSNPLRVLILEELGEGERDVSSLTDTHKVSQPTMSQHIAVLRAHKLVDERRVGRSVIYSLRDPELAMWIVAGMKFAKQESNKVEESR